MPDGKDGFLAVEIGRPLGSARGLGRAAGQIDLPAQAALLHAVLALHHHHWAAGVWPRHSYNSKCSSVLPYSVHMWTIANGLYMAYTHSMYMYKIQSISLKVRASSLFPLSHRSLIDLALDVLGRHGLAAVLTLKWHTGLPLLSVIASAGQGMQALQHVCCDPGLTLGQGPVLGADARTQQAVVEALRGEVGNEWVHAVLRVKQHGPHACTKCHHMLSIPGQ